ncbi:hypothetical protein EW146_g6869 [Bondarzewia mesenterica]|uniref:Sey1/RHD3-like three-helix bundle domain-containing protein n=1 Tax=Bondarzewia mesenterica TaxID=1095465 RepID=A0A4S4LN10_9AGAM|nr:hypothetical protein EW146_g6869 [Bondarzewia mesenterica]
MTSTDASPAQKILCGIFTGTARRSLTLYRFYRHSSRLNNVLHDSDAEGQSCSPRQPKEKWDGDDSQAEGEFSLTSQRTLEIVRKEKEQVDATGLSSFLDRMVQEKGNKSVLYIGFGSVLLPADPEMLYAVLRMVVKLSVPYVMVSSDTAVASLPPGLPLATKHPSVPFLFNEDGQNKDSKDKDEDGKDGENSKDDDNSKDNNNGRAGQPQGDGLSHLSLPSPSISQQGPCTLALENDGEDAEDGSVYRPAIRGLRSFKTIDCKLEYDIQQVLHLEAFDTGAKVVVVSDEDAVWNWVQELGLLEEELRRVSDQLRKDETNKMVYAIKISEPVDLLLNKASPDVWDSIRRTFKETLDKAETSYLTKAKDFDCTVEDNEVALASLRKCAWIALRAKIDEQTVDNVLLDKLRAYFEERFRCDDAGVPKSMEAGG